PCLLYLPEGFPGTSQFAVPISPWPDQPFLAPTLLELLAIGEPTARIHQSTKAPWPSAIQSSR
ncbi:MAG: hypothetical protein V2I33_20770, partial [Kangiellaceae bacterium]|nr:hypothetical protein [Kangiellaceae bacterium]